MRYLYDMRSGELVKSRLYSNGLNISDVLIKGPIEADFTTGTYKVNGAAKSFADLFTFNRAGKAWLVKDTGLQEYDIDVPRFDNGLLIERESTNYMSNAVPMASDGTSNFVFAANTDFGILVPNVLELSVNPDLIYSTRYAYQNLPVVPTTWSVYLRAPSDALIGFGGDGDGVHTAMYAIYNQITGELIPTDKPVISTVTPYKGWYKITAMREDNPTSLFLIYAKTGSINDVLEVALKQAEFGEVSSYILTSDSPVTRPADYLLNKITGTTVTGDWDSTLTLSIVNGNLVHSGYGRIRSLEIN